MTSTCPLPREISVSPARASTKFSNGTASTRTTSRKEPPRMGRRRSSTPRQKVDPTWVRDELIEKLLNEVAEENHKHLERAKLVVIVKPRGGRKGCCGGLGDVKTASRALLALLKDTDVGEP